MILAAAGVFVLAAACAPTAQARTIKSHEYPNIADKDIDFEDGVLVIEPEDYDWTVEITEDYELYIDGDRVRTDREQRSLLRRYYRQAQEIDELAGEIARDGAGIGIEGAKVGAQAIANVAKLLLDEYDSDDLDRDIEIDSKKLERMAKKIERKADRLESMVDDLDSLHRRLRRSISELDDLRGF
jgi:vacuolar-type H+-ATPase catalytic subunit A/Vma1